MKTLTQILGVALLFALVAFAGIRYGRKTAKKPVELIVVWDTTEVVKYDTITRYRPIYVARTVYDTVVTHFTTVEHDTVAVEVPMERRVYEEDSLYRAVLSGWRPSLDTLVIWPKTTTITIHEREVVPRSKWSFGVAIGPSVLSTPKGQVHAGLGATIGLQRRF